jgi:PadR family transcriptional regulator, regulatory protein PadR
VEALIPFIDTTFRTIADRDHRAMAGLSTGGMQTFHITLNHLDLFSHIGGFSGAAGAFTLGRDLDPKTDYNGVRADPAAFARRVKVPWLGVDEATPIQVVHSARNFPGRRVVYSCQLLRGVAVSKPTDLVQGTLDLLILRSLALEPMHGWAIAQRIGQVSGDVLRVGQGALYPALHKLEQQGWITAEWDVSDNNRRAKYYTLTRAGRQALAEETAQWERLSAAISLVVRQA